MFPYINREKSWLQFNERVLEEAEDITVPLINRIRFVGIFSNNLDEFFRVRYAYVRRLSVAGKSAKSEFGEATTKLLKEITSTAKKQQIKSEKLLKNLIKEMENENIFMLDELSLNDSQKEFARNFFIDKVSPTLMTIMLGQISKIPVLKDDMIYLAVEMRNSKDIEGQINYSLIEIPSKIHGRFIILPSEGDKKYIMLLDDLIRYNLSYIFRFFDFDTFKANTIKVTRDAELDIDNDISSSFIEKISRSIKKRAVSEAVRIVYDSKLSIGFLNKLKNLLSIDKYDYLTSGGRYHNKKDYISFPNLGPEQWEYQAVKPIPIKGLDVYNSIFEQLKHRDYLLYAPYHNFSYLVSFLKEAALDPKVETIRITIYRVADNSRIINALINAAKNGKKVIVQIELRARFDEASNVYWSEKMKAEGIHLIFGIRGLKVHAKACIIDRKEKNSISRYGFISTGNFNEATAKFYTDYTLLTANKKILEDVHKLFDYFEASYKIVDYKHLIVSPHYTRNKFISLINNEITQAKQGKEAFIKIRINSLVDRQLVEKFYEASNAGVKVQLIVRGICSLIPGVEGYSENIEVISIVDKYLEHPRVYIFGNNSNPKIYISSADLMTRNLDHRIEVSCPILDVKIKEEILENFKIMWSDNSKARVYRSDGEYYKINKAKEISTRGQFDTYDYYMNK